MENIISKILKINKLHEKFSVKYSLLEFFQNIINNTKEIAKEVHHSVKIENIGENIGDTEKIIRNEVINADIEYINAVKGYVRALNFLYDNYIKKTKIDKDFICRLHFELMKDESSYSGKFRTIDVEGRGFGYIYTPYQYIDMEVNIALENLYYDIENMGELLAIPKFIQKIVLVHPFEDGNGRLSRLLTLYLNFLYGYLPITIYENEKVQYIRTLNRSREKNNYTIFVHYYLDKMIEKYSEIIFF